MKINISFLTRKKEEKKKKPFDIVSYSSKKNNNLWKFIHLISGEFKYRVKKRWKVFKLITIDKSFILNCLF